MFPITPLFITLSALIEVSSVPAILFLPSFLTPAIVLWDKYTFGAKTLSPFTCWYSYHKISLSRFLICSFVKAVPIIRFCFLASISALSIKFFTSKAFPFKNLVPNFSIIVLSINWFS